jgi:hypothetical protein
MERKVMRKRNNLWILVVFFLSMSALTAQNTGYMGKRVIVNMGAEFSPLFRTFYVLDDFKYFKFNCILSPNIEVIATRRATAGVVYHYFNTVYNPYWDESEDLTTHGFGVFYKFSIAGERRALIGTYLKAQLDGFFFKCPEGASTASDNLFAVKIELGKDFLLLNRLHLSSGVSFGLPFGGYKALSYDNDFIGGIAGYGLEPINEYARSRIFGAYWFGFTVGIGFLAF